MSEFPARQEFTGDLNICHVISDASFLETASPSCHRLRLLSHASTPSMLLSQLKLTIERTFSAETYSEHPHIMHMPKDEWEKWFAEHSIVTSWRSKGVYRSQPKSGRKCKCNRDASTKVQCPTKITVSKLPGSELLEIKYFWEHCNHDPTTIRDMKESRNPDAVRTWLDERVAEGFNKKAIQAMLRLPSEELAELNVENESLPYSIKVTAQDIYNAVQRKAKGRTILAPELNESVDIWMAHLRVAGWSTLQETTPGEEGRGGYTIAFVSPWQKRACIIFSLF
ncbi:hypothetical protein M422DRAFT_266521 [Sphaerobolus stellatus SS14]|uniref:Uncharacterized protein n=1 Tax=Sphaerobolus stellatus (strain SS14) TaxID=990650 RepID=A0A0C9V2M0_SPHS4|nr:hypothetical protein M422DRAFT_266521 [Sphaerobolus stellatus SS14]